MDVLQFCSLRRPECSLEGPVRVKCHAIRFGPVNIMHRSHEAPDQFMGPMRARNQVIHKGISELVQLSNAVFLGLVNFVCTVFEQGDEMLTLLLMEKQW